VTGGYYREGQGIQELVKEVQGYVEQGYNAIKLKVGGISGGYTVEDACFSTSGRCPQLRSSLRLLRLSVHTFCPPADVFGQGFIMRRRLAPG
jgi:hypothetical protein